MRERGLKCAFACSVIAQILSLPMRERGLKYNYRPEELHRQEVAPHAGAWIEILLILTLI